MGHLWIIEHCLTIFVGRRQNPYVTEDFSLFPNKTTTNIIVEMYEREIIKNNLQLDQNIRE